MISHAAKLLSAASIGLLALIGVQPAAADPIFDTSGTFSVTGTNAPNNFTTNGIHVGAPITLIDSNALLLFQTIIPEPGGNEWIVWTFVTTSGGPIAGNLNANWTLQVGSVPLTGTFALKHFFNDWGTNGLLVSPTSANGSNNPLETNPITGVGKVFGQNLFIPTNVAGGTSSAFTFSGFLGGAGFNPSTLNTFQVGELLGPIPEPSSIAVLGAGLIAFAAVRRRKRG